MLHWKHTISLLTLVALLTTSFTSYAGRYRQPAYVTNAYFTNRILQQANSARPDHIINTIRSEYALSRGHFIVDLLADKGSHQIEIQLLDAEGKIFDKHEFAETTADKNNFLISINLVYGSNLPSGGIFLKILDSHNGKAASILGTFRIFTENWQ